MVVLTATTAIEKMIEAASQAINFSGECLTAMVEHPVYVFFLGAGLVSLGLGLVSQLRGTARG